MGLYEDALNDPEIGPPLTREQAILEDAVFDLMSTGSAELPNGTIIEFGFEQ